MDELDLENAALEAEIAQLEAAQKVVTAAPAAEKAPWYSPTQLAYDVGTGALKGFTGLADLVTTPGVAIARAGGLDVPYFGISQMLSEDLKALTEGTSLQEGSIPQELASFATPTGPGSLLKQAALGTLSYGGYKVGEAATESPYGSLVGALAAPGAAVGTGKALEKVAPKLEEAGLALQRRAIGITKADYKNVKNAIIETPTGEFSNLLKESVDDLIKNKTLGESIEPGAMYAELQTAKDSIEDAIQSALKAAEVKVGSVPSPTFDKTLDYISKNIAADEVENYVDRVIKFQDALTREGKGSLAYLNQQKKIVGENWKNSPQSDPGFWRVIYKDMKEHIEKYAPEVKDLNKQKQKLIVAEPVITRNFKASSGDFDVGNIQRLLNTTGGAGLAGGAILGAAAGNLTSGVLGALTLRALSTPSGQNLVGRGLRKASSLAESLSGATGTPANQLGLISGKGTIAAGADSGVTSTPEMATESQTAMDIDAENAALEAELAALEAQMAPAETVKVGKQNISLPTGENYAPPSLVKAVIAVESAGNEKAISSKGARGLMQLMPATAKELGVDARDPEQNVEGGSRYLGKLISKYKQPEIALAAYNWGPGNIDSAIKKIKADGKPVTWSRIKQYVKVPQETRLYVDKVLRLV